MGYYGSLGGWDPETLCWSLTDPGRPEGGIGVRYMSHGAISSGNYWGSSVKTIAVSLLVKSRFTSCKAPMIYLGSRNFDERNGDLGL